MTIDNEADAIARLDELRIQRQEGKQAEQDALSEIKTVLREASALEVDGVPINRSTLIDHSGLSRRTAYQIINEPDEESQS